MAVFLLQDKLHTPTTTNNNNNNNTASSSSNNNDGTSMFMNFQSYYESLPKTLPQIPLYWNDNDTATLHGSFLLQLIDERRDNITHDYYTILNIAPELASYSIDDFLWARVLVGSRTFSININGVKTEALIPYADMLNHRKPSLSVWTYNNNDDALVVTSLNTISINQQIYDSYGQKCNSRYLLNYGFTVLNNIEYNVWRFVLSLDNDDPALNIKRNLWGYNDDDSIAVHLSIRPYDRYALETLAYARFIVARGRELLRLSYLDEIDLQNPDETLDAISVDNEIRTLMLLRQAANDQLFDYNYEHSIEEGEIDGDEEEDTFYRYYYYYYYYHYYYYYDHYYYYH
jgi:histone-lysine N-methyltransferase SETD3